MLAAGLTCPNTYFTYAQLYFEMLNIYSDSCVYSFLDNNAILYQWHWKTGRQEYNSVIMNLIAPIEDIHTQVTKY